MSEALDLEVMPPPVTRQDLEDQVEILSMFRLQKRPAVVPWLEANIVIPRKMSPNSPGPFRTAGRPFQRPILECWHPDSGVNHCSVSAGTQLLKTTMMTLGISYRIKHAAMPTLMVGTSEKWVQDELSEKRMAVLINENPVLEMEKPADPDKFRTFAMDMSGGTITLVGGNSPNGLAGGSYGIVAIDEASKLVRKGSEQAGEAHPIQLADKRADDFGDQAFFWKSSTPNSPSHPFWSAIEEGDQTHFYVECPHCHEWFYYDFMGRAEDREEYEKFLGKSLPKEYKSLTWSKDAKGSDGLWMEEKVRSSVRYICPHNSCEIVEDLKAKMIEGCEGKAHHPDAAKNRKSFIIPSFYSPRFTFGAMAWTFLQSLQDVFGLQDYYNSRLARPWTEIAAHVKSDDVRKLRDAGKYQRLEIPWKPYRLVLTADVGDYKTHWMVTAIFDNDEMAVIDWGTVLTVEDLQGLPKLLKYRIKGTEEYLAPARGMVDAKDQTVRVYQMCQASKGFWFPASGSDSRNGSWGKQWLEIYNIDRYTFNTFAMKKLLYIELIKKQKAPRVYLPLDADEELIAGLSGQQLIVEKGEEDFKKLPNDHYGDCLIRALLAGVIWRAERGHGAPDMT